MNKGIAVLMLLIGLSFGYLLGNSGKDTAHEASLESHVSHEIRNVEENVPEIDLEIHGDNFNGYDAKIGFTNFKLAPEKVNGEYVEGEGHAHIYVDGIKLNRVYGEWYHLGKFGVGSHEVEVRLSSNDHFELAVNDEPILKNTVIVVRENDLIAEEDDHPHEEGVDEDHPHEEVEE